MIPHPQHQSGKPPEKPAVYLGSVYLNSYSNPLSTAKAPSRMMVLSHTSKVTLGQDFKQLHKKKAAFRGTTICCHHSDCSALLSHWISHSSWTGLSYLGYIFFSARTVHCSMLALCATVCPHLATFNQHAFLYLLTGHSTCKWSTLAPRSMLGRDILLWSKGR